MRRAKLYPYEQAILDATMDLIPDEIRAQCEAQVEAINKVQRLLSWNEIEFYCMSFFRVSWPEEILFSETDQIILGSGRIFVDTLEAPFTVWAAGGHIWSIESPKSLKPFCSESSICVQMYSGFKETSA